MSNNSESTKIYKPKPPKSLFDRKLEGGDHHYRRRQTASLLVNSGLPGTFQHKNFTVTIINPPHLADTIIGEHNEWLELSIWVVDNMGQELYINNPVQFQNPPHKVHDGTYHKEVDPIEGEVDIENYIDAPQESFKRIIGDLIDKIVRKNQGGQ